MTDQSINSEYVTQNILIKAQAITFSENVKTQLGILRDQIIENGSAKLLVDYDSAVFKINANKFSNEIQSLSDKNTLGSIFIGAIILVPWIMGIIDISVRLVK